MEGGYTWGVSTTWDGRVARQGCSMPGDVWCRPKICTRPGAAAPGLQQGSCLQAVPFGRACKLWLHLVDVGLGQEVLEKGIWV